MRKACTLVALVASALFACSPGRSRPPLAPTLHQAVSAFGTYRADPGFSIQYPLDWERVDEGDRAAFVSHAPPGTNLIEKRMEIDVRDVSGACEQGFYGGGAQGGLHDPSVLKGIEFLHQTGSGVALGNLYDWESYSTMKGADCITITFVLHSSSPGVYETEPAPFDREVESAIFGVLIDSFRLE
jgi:hypothetical protein